MRNYFITLLIAAVIGTVVSCVADGKYEKQMRYLISLICVLVILVPMKDAVEVFKDIDGGFGIGIEVSNGDFKDDRWIVERSVDELEKTLSEAAEYKFGIKVSEVEIVTYANDGLLYVGKIVITLLPSQAEYSAEVKEYFEKLLYTETEVIILEKE